MNVRNRRTYQTASGWDVEVARSKVLLRKWLDYWMNHLFDMTIRGPSIRRYWASALGAGFLAAGSAADEAWPASMAKPPARQR